MKTENLPETIVRAIERLGRIAASDATNPELQTAATQAPGLPVHHDMGGILVLRSDGSIAHYDPETERLSEVEDDDKGRWRTYALIQASRKFPELSQIHPRRPDGATACDSCGGAGKLFDTVDCGAARP